jgi:hypothetical protein
MACKKLNYAIMASIEPIRFFVHFDELLLNID